MEESLLHFVTWVLRELQIDFDYVAFAVVSACVYDMYEFLCVSHLWDLCMVDFDASPTHKDGSTSCNRFIDACGGL